MNRIKKQCRKVGCSMLTDKGYCEAHTIEKKKSVRVYDEWSRDKEHKRFYNSKVWKDIRKVALARDSYICVMCKREGKIVKADHVDHIKEMRDHFELRADLENLQSLCKPCHTMKTAKEKERRKREEKLK